MIIHRNGIFVFSSLQFAAMVLFAAFCQGRDVPKTQPAVAYITPNAVKPGIEVAVTFHDQTLGEPTGVWTSFSSHAIPRPSDGKHGQGSCLITASSEVPVGIYAARVMTSTGVSHLQLLMVDDLPTLQRHPGNTTIQTAQSVATPIAIEGSSEPVSAHYYRISATTGQRLSAEVVAQRIGSPMDPMIRLLDSSGRELVYSDDSPGAGADCRFRYVFPSGGEYTIEVRDVNYDGGPAYRYRLRLGDFPLVTMASPLGGLCGKQTAFHLDGQGCEQFEKIAATLPPELGRAWLNVKYPSGQGSALAPVLCTDIPEQVESESGAGPQTVNRISIPIAITGQLTSPGAIHVLEFQAQAGERLSIRGLTRAVSSPATLALKLVDADGKNVAESSVKGPDDAAIDATIAAAGIYRVQARELAGIGGPGNFYRLEIRPVTFGFTLAVDTEAVNAIAGKTVKIKVSVSRRDYAGPIVLSLTGDAGGLQIINNKIPADKKEFELEIKAPDEISGHQPMNFGIRGVAVINDHEAIESASTRLALKRLFPRLPYPPPEFDGMIGLGIISSSLPPPTASDRPAE